MPNGIGSRIKTGSCQTGQLPGRIKSELCDLSGLRIDLISRLLSLSRLYSGILHSLSLSLFSLCLTLSLSLPGLCEPFFAACDRGGAMWSCLGQAACCRCHCKGCPRFLTFAGQRCVSGRAVSQAGCLDDVHTELRSSSMHFAALKTSGASGPSRKSIPSPSLVTLEADAKTLCSLDLEIGILSAMGEA